MKVKTDLSSIPGSMAGKTCLVTGANSGLGKAMAIELARRGANVIMGCRREYFDALKEIRESSASDKVSLRMVDLASLESVSLFCEALRNDEIKLDILMCNAGMASPENKISHDGNSLIFQVNFLSYALMIKILLSNGVIPVQGCEGKSIPRIIFSSSTRHRGPLSIDFDHFGRFPEYSILETFRYYGLSKLYLMTYAWELGRRLQIDGKPFVSVAAFCPGSFRSRIGRNVGFLGNLVMSTRPVSPEAAAWPGIYLACAPEIEGTTLIYFHKQEQEIPDARAVNPDNGNKLCQKTEELLASYL